MVKFNMNLEAQPFLLMTFDVETMMHHTRESAVTIKHTCLFNTAFKVFFPLGSFSKKTAFSFPPSVLFSCCFCIPC